MIQKVKFLVYSTLTLHQSNDSQLTSCEISGERAALFTQMDITLTLCERAGWV